MGKYANPKYVARHKGYIKRMFIERGEIQNKRWYDFDWLNEYYVSRQTRKVKNG